MQKFKKAKRPTMLAAFKPSTYDVLIRMAQADGRNKTNFLERLIEAEAEKQNMVIDRTKDTIRID